MPRLRPWPGVPQLSTYCMGKNGAGGDRSNALLCCCRALMPHLGALQVYGYCMFKNGVEARVGYPTEGFEGDVAGRSFHNGRFVQRLRQAAAGAPGVALRQGTVRRLLSGAAPARAGGSGPGVVVPWPPRHMLQTWAETTGEPQKKNPRVMLLGARREGVVRGRGGHWRGLPHARRPGAHRGCRPHRGLRWHVLLAARQADRPAGAPS